MFRIIKNDPNFICDKVINKKERNIAKAMIFKIIFGGSEFTVSQDLGVPIEDGKIFYDSLLDGYRGLRENFESTKKLALKRGWIELDPYTKKRYFFADFNKMKTLFDKAWSYYPDGYRDMSKEQKEVVKKDLKENCPELSGYWKEYMVYKGKLERAGLNYRIQGNAASMTKLAVILIEKDLEANNYPFEYGIVLAVHD